MKQFLISAFFLICISTLTIAQTFNLSFTASRDSEIINAILVKNLNSGDSIKFDASEILHLIPRAEAKFLKTDGQNILIYPNPSEDLCYIEFLVDTPQKVLISLNDLNGKNILKWSGNLSKAVHVFQITNIYSGVYNITISSDSFYFSNKLVALGYQNSGAKIEKIQVYETEFTNNFQAKDSKSDILLGYSYGDLLLIEALSNEGHKTLKPLILNQSDQNQTDRQIDIEFYSCLDYENNMYKTVEIGNYIWMAEDIKSTKYRDGSIIPKLEDNKSWINTKEGAICYYDNDKQNSLLYNWYACNNEHNICPSKWHFPTDDEWAILEKSIGLNDSLTFQQGWRGDNLSWKLKEPGINNWLSNEGKLVNLSGFSAIPNGIRNFAGNFFYKGTNSAWWTKTESDDIDAWCRALQYDTNSIYREKGRKTMGFSLRCIKNYPPIVNTVKTSNISIHEANCEINIINNGGAEVLAAGLVWGTFSEVTIEQCEAFSNDFANNYSFISQMTMLSDSTEYFVRAYAKNEIGTGYGEAIKFTTLADTINKSQPSIETLPVTNISFTNAECGGNIIAEQEDIISEKGIVWSTNPNPDMLSNFTGYNNIDDEINIFTIQITGLSHSTQYYVSAYIKHDEEYIYGQVNTFTTPERGEDVTDIDGNIYYTIKMGSNYWTSSNLKTEHFNNNNQIPIITGDWNAKSIFAMAWYDDQASYGDIYGGLYSWACVDTNSNGGLNICPSGYHVANNNDWTELINDWGGENFAANPLKEAGFTHWNDKNTGTNISGFAALPAGMRASNNSFVGISELASFWTTDFYDEDMAYAIKMLSESSETNLEQTHKNSGLSVRCVKNKEANTVPNISNSIVSDILMDAFTITTTIISTGGTPVFSRGVVWSTQTDPNIENNQGNILQGNGIGQFTCTISNLIPHTTYYVKAYAINEEGISYSAEINLTTDFANCGLISDLDGNTYQTVSIGSQCWLRNNLQSIRYLDNTLITENTDASNWESINTPSYCWYNNEQNNYGDTYGALYNWYAVDFLSNGGRYLCPEGWRIPIINDWIELANNLGGLNIAGEALKEDGIDHWLSPNTDANNSSGFTALPAGNRDETGIFENIGEKANFWTSTEFNEFEANSFSLNNTNSELEQNLIIKKNGFSLRCLKNEENASLPTVITYPPTDLTHFSVNCSGEVTDQGSLELTTCGILYSENSEPSLSNYSNITISGNDLGQFTEEFAELSPQTTYYIRAYAINPIGIAYGNIETITTLEDPNAYDGDGNIYTPITIGTQIWLKENLWTTTFNDHSPITYVNEIDNLDTVSVPKYTWYEFDFDQYGTVYGGLYNYLTTDFVKTKGKSICPVGYHVPDYTDWTTLINFAGGIYTAGAALKSTSLWEDNGEGSDLYGFSALPAGTISVGDGFYEIGEATAFWCLNNIMEINLVKLFNYSTEVQLYQDMPFAANSLRCIKNKEGASIPNNIVFNIENITWELVKSQVEVQNDLNYDIFDYGVILSTEPEPNLANYSKISIYDSALESSNFIIGDLEPETTYYIRAFATNPIGVGYSNTISFETNEFLGIFDGDDNEYTMIKIGNQKWLKENLKTTSYNDGEAIDPVYPDYYWYNDDYNTYGETFGALYKARVFNFMLNGGKQICPEGWHIPTEYEWQELADYASNNFTTIASALKSTEYWASGSEGNDDLNFNALPAGFYSTSDGFMNIYDETYFWTSDLLSNNFYYTKGFNAFNDDMINDMHYEGSGLSIRCLKNSYTAFLPKLIYNDISTLTSNSFDITGNLSNDTEYTISAKGLILSTTSNVNLANAQHTFIKNNTYEGNFIISANDLNENTTYYCKLFATNNLGVGYSDEFIVTTPIDYGIVDGNGNVYASIDIYSQNWLSTNIRATSFNNASPIVNLTDNADWINANEPAYCFYDNDEITYSNNMYGGLYNYNVVNPLKNKGRNICPVGYHIPQLSEWTELINNLGGASVAGGILKDTGTSNWQTPNTNATDDFGFTALPGGNRTTNASYTSIGTDANLWYNSPIDEMSSNKINLSNTSAQALTSPSDNIEGLSIRCIKNATETTIPVVYSSGAYIDNPATVFIYSNIEENGNMDIIEKGVIWNKTGNPNMENAIAYKISNDIYEFFETNITGLEPGQTYYFRAFAYNGIGIALGNVMSLTMPNVPTPIDGDGNIYDYVLIGNQFWLKSNLKTTKFNDGTPIQNFDDNNQWENASIPAYCYYDNDDIYNGNEFGVLYNSLVVAEDQNLNKNVCPIGWRVADDYAWNILIDFLGGEFVAGNDLKETGNEHWNNPQGNTNTSGFSALGSGYRTEQGTFMDLLEVGTWWIKNPSQYEAVYKMFNNSPNVTQESVQEKYGAAIRCVLD